jgi:hypothetical protein
MANFEQALWGYGLSYPDGWTTRSFGDVQGLAPDPRGLEPDASGPGSGHLLIHPEWNPYRRPAEPLWQAHIARFSTMAGARQVGSAPWAMGGGFGFEAEIALPKKDGRRLWVGILTRATLALKFMVVHPMEDRAAFEPQVTQVLKSLQFLDRAAGVRLHPSGMPLPPDCREIDPAALLTETPDAGRWTAFETPHSMGGLQAFYWREPQAHGWEIEAFEPFPGDGELGFARAGLRRGGLQAALGLIPFPAGKDDEPLLGRIAFRITREV